MCVLEKFSGRRDILRRHRQRLGRHCVDSRARGEDGERVVRFGVLQERADHIDLHTGEQRVAIGRRVEQKDPVAPLPPALGAQLRLVAQHDIPRLLVLEGREPWRVVLLAAGEPAVERKDNVFVRLDELRVGSQFQASVAGDRLPFVRIAVPIQVGPVTHVNLRRPFSHDVHVVPGGEAISRAAVAGVELLRVADDDPLFLPRLQREHPHLERAAVDPLQESRIEPAIHNCLENLPGVVPFGHAAFHQLSIDVHGQAGKRRVGREREVERAFQSPRGVIEIRLVDGRAGEAVFDVYVDVVLAQRKLHLLPVGIDGDQSAAGMFAGRHERRFGRRHQVFCPGQAVRRAGRGHDFRLARYACGGRDDLLAGQYGRIDAADAYLALRNHYAVLVTGPHGEPRSQRRYLATGGLDHERGAVVLVRFGRIAVGDFQIDFALVERDPPVGVELDGCVFVEEQYRPVRQADAPPLALLGGNRIANLGGLQFGRVGSLARNEPAIAHVAQWIVARYERGAAFDGPERLSCSTRLLRYGRDIRN